jgi:hypothetical protein
MSGDGSLMCRYSPWYWAREIQVPSEVAYGGTDEHGPCWIIKPAEVHYNVFFEVEPLGYFDGISPMSGPGTQPNPMAQQPDAPRPPDIWPEPELDVDRIWKAVTDIARGA